MVSLRSDVDVDFNAGLRSTVTSYIESKTAEVSGSDTSFRSKRAQKMSQIGLRHLLLNRFLHFLTTLKALLTPQVPMPQNWSFSNYR